jgi:hypothetical protein
MRVLSGPAHQMMVFDQKTGARKEVALLFVHG